MMLLWKKWTGKEHAASLNKIKIKKRDVFCGDCKFYRKEDNRFYMEGASDPSYKYNHVCVSPQNHFPKTRVEKTWEKETISKWVHKESPKLWNRNNDCPWFRSKKEGDWKV